MAAMGKTIRRCAGFTLLEALVVMAVLGILLTLAVPAVSALRQQHQMQAQAEGLLDSLLLARSEALRRQQRVTVCVRGTDAVCDLTGGWQQGWLVFEDLNNNALHDPGEGLIEVHPALPSTLRLVGKTTVNGYMSYSPEGRSVTRNGAFLAGTLSLCHVQLAQGWQLVINALGKPRLQKYTPTACS